MSPFPNNPFRRKFWNLFNNVLTGLWELGLSFLGSLRYVCLEFLVVMKAQEKAEVILGFHCWRAAEPLTGGFVIGCPWELPKCLVLWNACFSYTHMNQKTFCLEKSNTGGLKKKKVIGLWTVVKQPLCFAGLRLLTNGLQSFQGNMPLVYFKKSKDTVHL